MKRMMGLLLALAVVVAASFAVVAQARPAGTASPAGGRNHRSADVTFTPVPQLAGTKRGCKPPWVVGLRSVEQRGGVCLHAEGADALGRGHV